MFLWNNLYPLTQRLGFPHSSVGKEYACNSGDLGSIPGLGRFPWRREWQPIPVLLPGKSHGRRNLAGYSPWGRKSQTVTKPPPLPHKCHAILIDSRMHIV